MGDAKEGNSMLKMYSSMPKTGKGTLAKCLDLAAADDVIGVGRYHAEARDDVYLHVCFVLLQS